MVNRASRGQVRGFTLVELLVVIVVIAILASISIVAYNGVQTRAEATVLANSISQVEKGFQMYLIVQGLTEYPRDTTFAPGNPTISAMGAADPVFSEYVPATSHNENWQYDNDKDSSDPDSCMSGTSDWTAVNIALLDITPEVAQELDNMIDDGDLACGKVRKGNVGATRVTYKLSFDQLP